MGIPVRYFRRNNSKKDVRNAVRAARTHWRAIIVVARSPVGASLSKGRDMSDHRLSLRIGASHADSRPRCVPLRLALASMVALAALGLSPSASYASDTNVVTGAVASVVTKVGWLWDTYTVTTTVTIHYAGLAAPNAPVYYDLYLWEEDVILDDQVAGPLSICIQPNQWNLAIGGPQTTVTVSFTGVSGWFGDDWYVADTCEVACSERYAYVGGSVDRLPDETFEYEWALINDPTGIGMVNTDPVVALQVGNIVFDLDVPLFPGDVATLTLLSSEPPAIELQDYVVTFQDGLQVTGVTLAPVTSAVFVRGDSNSDHVISVNDALGTLGYLFNGAPLTCGDAADFNDDGSVAITDVIATLNYLFLNDPPPPGTFPAASQDPTDDLLDCEQGSSVDQYLEDHGGV